MNTTQKILCLVPFVCFALGYALMSYFYAMPRLVAPSLVGQTALQALSTIAPLKVNIKIIGQRQENDLEEGTILSQNPLPDTAIKSNQTIYCITSVKPPSLRAPVVVGKNLEQITHDLSSQKIPYKIHYVSHSAPVNQCVAQSPHAEQSLNNKPLLVFVSQGNKKPLIWPNFIGRPVTEVTDFLSTHSLQPTIIHRYPVHEKHVCHECRVVNQRPIAGTFIMADISTLKSIQLEVT
ncbi:hypothetical protein Noda2021_08910 [Candidatus Dependentiae bacterium Noda2021]|nr:hypothetical protein Noda2021_08910 [Candidatus Dependentiae bacterium Noda2021]